MFLPHSGPEHQGGQSVAANPGLLNSFLMCWLHPVVTAEVPNNAATSPVATTNCLGEAAGPAVCPQSFCSSSTFN